jgi:DNA-binding NarL/FixJ family response regulator
MPLPQARIRILLVDDHAMVRRGMRDFLALHDDLEVVGEAADGTAAIEAAATLQPDVVVMDLLMPGVDGIDATELGITERTARTHVSNILAKLGLSSRTPAALRGVEHGLDRHA